MLQVVQLALLWFGAVGCAVIGGVYFAFSTFVMPALGRLDPPAGAQAMQAVNDVILRSLFMPLFFGTTLASAAVAVLHWSSAGAGLSLLAAIIYVIGMFVVTIVFNVPFNNALAATRAAGDDTAAVWHDYLRDWTFWNHVRTVASIAASALYIAILARG